jgi:hypothetical protein
VLTIPKTSINDPAARGFAARYDLDLERVRILGDFDASVDFRILEFPPGSGVRIGFSTSKGGVERVSFNTTEQRNLDVTADQYVADFSPSGPHDLQLLKASGTKGSLRFTRTDSETASPTLTAYMMDEKGRWVSFGSLTGPGAAGPFEYFGIAVWGHSDGSFGFLDTKVAFENFAIQIFR